MADDRDARIAQLEVELRRARADNAALREEQTASAEILRVIASSPADLQRVLNTVADSAVGLCEAGGALIWRIDGDVLRLVAACGPYREP
jgi:hypothetical protein